MKTIYNKLCSVNPFSDRTSDVFYLNMLSKNGIRVRDWKSVAVVLDSSVAVKRAIEQIDNATEDRFHDVCENTLEIFPTNIRVLIAIGESALNPELSYVMGLAARQLADTVILGLGPEGDDDKYVSLHLSAFDLMIRSLVEMQSYAQLQRECLRLIENDSHAVPWFIINTCFELATDDCAEAQIVFESFIQIAENLHDDAIQLEAKLARVVRHYALHGIDTEFAKLVRSLAESDSELHALLCRNDFMAYAKEQENSFIESNAQLIVERMLEYEYPNPGFCDIITSLVQSGYRIPLTVKQSPPTGNPMKDLHRLMDRQQFNSIEEAQEWMNGMMGRRIPEIPLNELTPDEVAQDLCEEARTLPPDQRLTVLQGIASDFPSSMWPWLEMCAVSATAEQQLQFSEEGLMRGAHFETEEYVRQNKGQFWGLTETRPYMQLIMRKGQALTELGRKEDAIVLLTQALVLNPHDNLELRCLLLPLLISRGLKHHLEFASQLIKQFEDDMSGLFLWSRVLFLAVTNATPEELLLVLNNAVKANALIGVLLTTNSTTDIEFATHQASHSEMDEAAAYNLIGVFAWENQRDAWMKVKKILSRHN